ncbi:MAG: bifunctional diaminohydroxyphosphoribosylaminopyrimidine deaminase/5-amino-6-(5-phosphoribosylamino)uracil reductase RibD [Verrucomicrobiota bacterium]|nr:bifunctional diaminohydroxyphosphoribosylaminopyrimidine deaminase/5-amino-6-(5-phosphoribosylamino)uracil reductase RibD [Verrucomicrobiota bacterium]
MNRVSADETFMRAALKEAQKGIGHTSPNPAVGAVLVVDGKIVARGHHRAPGAAHAEVECLRAFGKLIPRGATLYVTLEPCSTSGRTPACTRALIEASVESVVVGALDVNPAHNGAGIELLRVAGMNVRTGVLADECVALNEAFNKWIVTRRPLVIAKCGMSLDGHLTRQPNEPKWITSAAARRHANHFRAQVDAILIGAETLRADNPSLTARVDPGARQPWRVVLSRSGRIPRDAHLFTDRFLARTLVFRKKSLGEVLDELGRRDITSVLIEGGGEVLGQALDQRLIDRVRLYLGPVFTGGPVLAFPGLGASSTQEALRLHDLRYERIGDDVFVTGRPAPALPSSE